MKKPPRNPAAPAVGSPTARTLTGPGKVRLIGGRWRGTRLAVGDSAGLRPTSDRVRETLFNWLLPQLPGARVLDLFAGTGALGLEAVSRGAASAVLVERDPVLATALREVATRLPGGDAVTVVHADARDWLRTQAPGSFDLAFVDPPFAADLWDAVLPELEEKMAPEAWLYVEAPLLSAPGPGQAWTPHREGRTREVRYTLFRRTPAISPTQGTGEPGRAATGTLPADTSHTDSAAST